MASSPPRTWPPRGSRELAAAWARGDLRTARDLGHALARLSAAAFAEPNPTVIKGALHALGRIPTPQVRLPLLPATAESVDALLARLAELGEDGGPAGALAGRGPAGPLAQPAVGAAPVGWSRWRSPPPGTQCGGGRRPGGRWPGAGAKRGGGEGRARGGEGRARGREEH